MLELVKKECLCLGSKILYINKANIFTPSEILQGTIVINDGIIHDITTKDIDIQSNENVIDAQGLNVIPGFIDGHIHDAAGSDTMDATEDAIDTMTRELTKEGTKRLLK